MGLLIGMHFFVFLSIIFFLSSIDLLEPRTLQGKNE